MRKNYSIAHIKEVAKYILSQVGQSKCLAFFAPMGAGKTTLIHAICDELDVIDNVSSPTYSIINEYKTKNNNCVTHMDWYRLKDEADALNAGVEDYLIGGAFCLVEWPERAESLLPQNCLKIAIEVLGATERSIYFME